MDLFDVDDLIAQHDEREHSYAEFFRGKMLSLGLAIWPAGQLDRQTPHAEDEVYFIVSGRAWIRVGDDDRPVRAGSIVFVATGIEHHFHDIEETLRVVVFWAPPHHARDAAVKP
jgi:mannose-6-phosphate isomerase-like protein (cupin superfamily)